MQQQSNTYEATGEGKPDVSEATGMAPCHKITGKELFRSAWHAFPGFLTLWLLFTFFADKPLRTWWVGPVSFIFLSF